MAESLGASSLYRFLTITFPLIRPGYIAGAFMVFVYTLGDWITPVFLGSGAFLPAASYYNITQFIDERLYRMGLVAASLIITITVGLLILATRYVGLREYSSVLVSAASMREEGLHGWRKNVFVAGPMAVGLVATLPYISLVFGAFSKEWGLTPIPTAWGLERFTSILWAVRGSIINTVIFSVSATLITLVAGFLVAYLLARGSFPGKTLPDSTVTMMLAVPGLILGIGYLRAFREPIFGFPLTESVLVMIILLAARRVPFVIRSAYASLRWRMRPRP
jgi:iron(III) transport system permease protein